MEKMLGLVMVRRLVRWTLALKGKQLGKQLVLEDLDLGN
jgi:hypothetical protein